MAVRPLSVASWGLIGGLKIVDGPLEVYLEELWPLEVYLEGNMSGKIKLKQGEAKILTLAVKGRYGAVVDLSGATLFLGVKRKKTVTAYIFSKVDADFDKTDAALGIVTVYFSATDTMQTEDDYFGELKCSWSGSPEMIEKSADFIISIKKSITT